MFKRFNIWRVHHIDDRTFLLILSVLVGIMSGIMAWMLKFGVFLLHDNLRGDLFFDWRNFHLFFLPVLGLVLTVVFKVLILNDQVRHNISSILYAIAKRNSLMRVHKVFSSVIGAILTVGFGGSVGLESPVISSGAAIGSNLGRFFHLNYKSITTLLGCGAAGAVSAIFTTPIAGIVFALEVLLLDLTRFSLIPLLMASVSGALTTSLLFTDNTSFEIVVFEPFLVRHIFYYILLGVAAGFVSSYFTRFFMFIEGAFLRIKNVYKRLLIGAPLLGVVIYLFPALYGEGFDVIKAMLRGSPEQVFDFHYLHHFADELWFLLAFFTALICLKVVASAITVGSGGVGGIFAPSLFTGGILGFLFAYCNNSLVHEQLSKTNFALVGMGGVLAGVLQAPLTGIFLIAEITNGYELIVPLMLVSTIAYVTARAMNKKNIITWQLEKRGDLVTHHKDKAVLHFLKISKLIETDLITVSEKDTLGDLVKVISRSQRNIFPVLSQEGYLLGVILLDDVRDIMFNKDYYDTSVLNLAHMPPAIIKHNDSMERVMQLFNETDAWNLPVCRAGLYQGFVSKSKMFSAYREQLVNLTEE